MMVGKWTTWEKSQIIFTFTMEGKGMSKLIPGGLTEKCKNETIKKSPKENIRNLRVEKNTVIFLNQWKKLKRQISVYLII